MRNKFVGYGTFLVLAIGVGIGAMLTHQASAATFGVSGPNVGYYDQQPHDANFSRFFYTDGIPANWQVSPTTADMFIQATRDYLYNTGLNAAIHQQEYADARASMMINTMMGVESNDPRYNANPGLARWQNGVALAKSLFNQWEATVRGYDNKDPVYGGAVDFNVNLSMNSNDFVGLGSFNAAPPAVAPRGSLHGDLPDVMYAPTGQLEQSLMIVFTHRDGSQYLIKKMSGNISAASTPFPQLWSHRPNIVEATPQGAVTVGTVLSFTGSVTNTGRIPSGGGVMYGRMQQDSMPSQDLIAVNFGPLLPGQTSASRTFSYTVPPFTAAGTQFNFYVTVDPEDYRGLPVESGRRNYRTGYASYPSIQGENGDIQAGGGICNSGTYTSGNIKGSASGISVGDYVVAASGQINNFRSNGTGVSDSLALGANGGYARACRPNLMQVALDGRRAGEATLPAIVDLGSYTRPGMPNVYYYDGTDELVLSGTVYSKTTIIAPLARVRIAGPILLQSNTIQPSRSVASLGIIAQGDIFISPQVTRVDAYLFSNGTINTCAGTSSGSACATPELLVNGFLMGKNLVFNRLGRLNTGGAQISERIVLTPQLYLNPPKFFEESTKEVLQAQGEKPPLF